MDVSSMTDAELFANLQAVSNEIQSRLMKKDAAIVAKSRELADSARSFAESERFLKLQLRVKTDEITRIASFSPVSSPGSPKLTASPSSTHSADAVALQGKDVIVKHPVKGMPAISGVVSLEHGNSRVRVNAPGGFMWSGEIARDLSSSAFGLQFCGFNAIEHFPGGSCATFTLNGQLVACFTALLPHSNPLIHAQGYAHGQFTSTFAGGSVAGSEMYEHGVLLRAQAAE